MSKIIEKGVLNIYDTAIIPKGMTVRQVLDISKEYGVIFWDSHAFPDAKPPYFLDHPQAADYINTSRIVDIHDEPELYKKIINHEQRPQE